jgi:hypothetical protein
MMTTRRALLVSGIGTVSALAILRTDSSGSAKLGQSDPIALMASCKSDEKSAALGNANRGQCSDCTYFKVKTEDAFGNCPMSARVSRWQQRPACSTYTMKISS